MHLCLVCVGRRARDPLLDAADDYVQRLRRFGGAEIQRCKEQPLPALQTTLARQLRADEPYVALDERGELWSTSELAQRLRDWQRQGLRRVAFLIGGADGLPAEIKRRATAQLALSRMTLPHRLALVIIAEQLYRAHTVLAGEPYHHGQPG